MKGILLFLLLLPGLFAFADQPGIIVVGDVHGDFNSFQTILQTAGILDTAGNWSGGPTILVQSGDAVDRGSRSKQVLDLLMKLESQAEAKGGRVHPLLGNHEVLVMMGDLRYVPPEEFANHAGPQSEKRLRSAFAEFKQFKIRQAEQRKQKAPEFTTQMEEEWFKAHPKGYLEFDGAFAPAGKYGKWLRKHNAVFESQGNIFLHGGISPKISPMAISEINDRVRREIQLFDRLKKAMVDQKVILPFFTFNEMIESAKEELAVREKDEMLEAFLGVGSWVSVNPEGPLWFRGYAEWTDQELSAALPALLEAYKAKRFIVGHTVMKNGEIQTRHNHGAILVDTGMNRDFYPQGRASALEIRGEKLTAVYSDNKVILNP